MSIRLRLALAAGAAVAVAVALASVAAYLIVSDRLHDDVDRALRTRAQAAGRLLGLAPAVLPVLPPLRVGAPAEYVQLVRPLGRPPLRLPGQDVVLPVDAADRAVAARTAPAILRTVRVGGSELRLITSPGPRLTAIQIARPLDQVNEATDQLARVLLVISLAGIGLGVAVGLVVSRAALRPVARLTARSEAIAGNPDLSLRLDEGRRDELGRLAGAFNRTLDALESSVTAQRRLMADASHELRTPVASMRTNIEVLRQADRLSPDEREELIGDLVGQADELTALVGDVVELARDGEPRTDLDDVRLDEVVASVAERMRRRHPGLVVTLRAEPALVRGVPDRVARAVGNLLDNAAKWGPPEGPVEVTVAGGEVAVRDHGPGFAADDLPHVFERFYRAPGARSMPGSGLGLAIVREVAVSSGGSAWAANAEGGGGVVRMRLPLAGGEDEVTSGPGAATPS